MMQITPSTAADLDELAADLHPDDRAEIEAAQWADVRDTMVGIQSRALRFDGRLVCLFGVNTMARRAGIPWMLCTTALDGVPRRAMAEVCRRVADEFKADHDDLLNLVHRHNSRALRFVRWLGFEVNTTPTGPGGEFYLFQWRRHV
jgi:hypothetical protein